MLELSSLCIRFLIPLWLLSGIYKSKKRKQYEKQYKNTILSSFVNLYDKNFEYKSELLYISRSKLDALSADFSDSIGIFFEFKLFSL